MPRKLSDAEFIERTRLNNRRRSERQRQRLANQGKTALTVWIPEPIRAALAAKAANSGATIADTAAIAIASGLMTEQNETLSAISTELLSAALNTPFPSPVRTASNDATPDMFGEPTNTKENDFSFVVVGNDKDALMNEVGKLLDAGLTGSEIARRLNAAGHRTANGTEFIGANLLRDYKKWSNKQ